MCIRNQVIRQLQHLCKNSILWNNIGDNQFSCDVPEYMGSACHVYTVNKNSVSYEFDASSESDYESYDMSFEEVLSEISY